MCCGKGLSLFDAAVYVKWLRCAPVILYCSLDVDAERFNATLQFWWVPILGSILNRASPLIKLTPS